MCVSARIGVWACVGVRASVGTGDFRLLDQAGENQIGSLANGSTEDL